MRLSMGVVIVLALLPIALSVAGFYSAHFILSAPEKVDWVPIGAPPGGAVQFVDQTNLVKGDDGKLYLHDGHEWSLESDQSMIAIWEYDESCQPVVFPKGTTDRFQDCRGYSDDYYAILKDGTCWYYTYGGDDEFRYIQFVVEFTVKVVASIVGLAFGVGILVLVGIMGIKIPIK
jgi:hypothetical protein